MEFNRLWIIGRKNDKNHIRFYPNPGFVFTMFGKTFKWNKHYGWKVRNASVR
jgi:hypothetical protein